jgi:DNA-binding NtrC family response regulator
MKRLEDGRKGCAIAEASPGVCISRVASTRVLLVEDDRPTADLYALKLRLDGHSVEVAHDAPSAERLYWQTSPCVVCVDHWLPGGPGTELAQRLADRGTAVILLTNDQVSYERPPAGVRSLLKANTEPGRLSRTVSELAEAIAIG